jgi:hypothetical protein
VRRHELDVVSLVLGLFFVGSALVWGVTRDPVQASTSWRLPALLIVVGTVGLLSSLANRRGRSDPAADRDTAGGTGATDDPPRTP